MKYYNKETRIDGRFYRTTDWSVENIRNNLQNKDNFTTLTPPEETLVYGVPCDFIGDAWVIDTDSDEYKNLYQQKRQYEAIGEQLDKLWHNIDDGELDKTGSFYTSIKAVKDEFPKG